MREKTTTRSAHASSPAVQRQPVPNVHEVRLCLSDCVKRSARAIASACGVPISSTYAALRWLEAAGEVERDADHWPALWSTTTTSSDEALGDERERCEAAASLLAEAMALPEWATMPRAIAHKVEHAYVELTHRLGDGDTLTREPVR